MGENMSDDELIDSIYSAYRENESTVEFYKGLSAPNVDVSGKPALVYAASRADADAVEALIAKGADPSETDSNGSGALHNLAYEVSNFQVPSEKIKKTADILIDAGVSPLKKNSDGQTYVILAAQRGVPEIIASLVERKKKTDITDNDGNTPLHVAADYSKNASESFLKYTLPNYQKVMADPKTHESVKESQQEQHDRDKAQMDSYFLIVKLLIEGGADPDRKNNYGKTPKEFAFDTTDVRVAAVLNGTYIDGAQSEEAGAKGMDAVQAVARRDHDALKSALKAGADPNGIYDKKESIDGVSLNGRTPLGIACAILDDESVRILAENGADPNLKDNDSKLPLAYSLSTEGEVHTSNNTFENKVVENIVQVLNGKGLDINATADPKGNTLLLIAISKLDSSRGYNRYTLAGKFAEVLLRSGADPNAKNNDGVAPLMLVSASESSDAGNLQLEILEKGADVSVKDINGRTPLIYAAGNRKHSAGKDMAEILFEFGDPQISAAGNDRKTALDVAVEVNNEGLVTFLLGKS
jgi:ankyrin repeat protein